MPQLKVMNNNTHANNIINTLRHLLRNRTLIPTIKRRYMNELNESW